jgi:hypothetical protein
MLGGVACAVVGDSFFPASPSELNRSSETTGDTIGGNGGISSAKSVDQKFTSYHAAQSKTSAPDMTCCIKPYDALHKNPAKKTAKPALARLSEVLQSARDQNTQRYGPVTRTEPAKSGQNSIVAPITKTPALDLDCPIGLDVFCDWLTIYQDHVDRDDLPVINDGYVVRFETDAIVSRGAVNPDTGEYAFAPMFDAAKAEYTVSRRMEHEGSYDTKVSIRCDGRRVELSGNVGRFGRTDNLFGVKVLETVQIANEILAVIGLPPFTGSEKATPLALTDSFYQRSAVITRVDLTANFATGSRHAAFRVLHWMSGQGSSRNSGKNPRNYGNGITWNEGSKRHYEKLYFKADELGKFVSDEVKTYCEENGILRYEISLKARELADRGIQSMAGWSRVSKEGNRMENVIYGKFAEVLTRNQVTVTEIQDIPGKLGLIARSYLNGENPYEAGATPERTRRRWRAELMKYGVDIAQAIDVTRLTTRIRVIELQPLTAPGWYQRTAA